MQISTANSAGSSLGLQALRDLFQPRSQSATGQSMPTSEARGSEVARKPSLAPGSMTGGGFDPATLASLFSTQEGFSTPARSLISQVDTTGDGALDLTELGAALGVDTAEINESFGQIDGDDDGMISETELDEGMKALFERNGPPRPPSEAEMVSSLLSIADTDRSNALSLDEILASFGEADDENASTSISDSFGSFDADGDAALSAEELAAAIQSMIGRTLSAYQSETAQSGLVVSHEV